MNQEQQEILDRHTDELCNMLSDYAEELKSALRAEMSVMLANLRFEYAKKLKELKNGE